ncbi:MAG: lysophospholipid acyltransferase family protein, partial [Candidatus Eisenbacteria bacterium]|nr:lysophospholipid acyltransferase family protein [Candidatus Eisenbacteria bacterium]
MIPTAFFRLAEWMVRNLPRKLTLALGLALARAAFALGVPARRALESNLAPLVGRRAPAERAARAGFEHFARAFIEFLELEGMSLERLEAAVELQGGEHLEAARASGRGVIVLSAHLGNWEWGAARLALRGPRLHIAARRHGTVGVESIFDRRRRTFGLERVCERPLWVGVARLLRAREWVALMGDRAAPGTRHSVCAWAAALARRTGALVLPAVTVRVADS